MTETPPEPAASAPSSLLDASGAEEIVQSYFVCLDTEDWDRMRTLWHPEAELRAVGARPRHGIDDVITYFSKLFDPWPRHTDSPTRLMRCGDTFTVEVTFIGTTPDGREISFDAVDIFDLHGGLIRRLANWYDIAYARRVLSDAAPG